MDYAKTALLIAVDEKAAFALRRLTESFDVPESGTNREAIIEKAMKDCEMARRAVVEDFHAQLR